MNYEEIKQPNWLFCLSNELHDAKAATMLMKTQRLRCVFDASATKTLMRLNGWLRYGTEDCLYFIFNIGREKYCYTHIFRDVTDSDLTDMRVRYDFRRMYLVDTPEKTTLIATIAHSLYLETQSNRQLEDKDVNELQEKSVVKLAHCEVR